MINYNRWKKYEAVKTRVSGTNYQGDTSVLPLSTEALTDGPTSQKSLQRLVWVGHTNALSYQGLSKVSCDAKQTSYDKEIIVASVRSYSIAIVS